MEEIPASAGMAIWASLYWHSNNTIMIFGFFRSIEKSIPLFLGILFTVVGFIAAFNLPNSQNKVVGTYLTYLVFHTAIMLIVGMYMKKRTNVLAISWFFALIFFFVVAVIFKN
jgi:uncharacterized membrane protein YgdD (TMEM256/DUF423 family)